MNNLKRILKENSMTITELANLIGKGAPVVWRWAENRFDPSLKNAFLIEERTDGRIKAKDILSVE